MSLTAMKSKKNRKQQPGRKMSNSSAVLLFAGLALLVSTLFVVQRTDISMVEYNDREKLVSSKGVLSIPIDAHDFGEVSKRGGVVSTSFPLVNIGEEDIEISFIETSCGCTTARVINGDEVGPLFGMKEKGTSHAGWITVMPPGGKAELIVFYDPNVHPDFRGVATRTVTLTSNDKLHIRKTLKIKVNQVE